MTTILACGEGYHDVGVLEWDKSTASHVFFEGWMQPIIRKCAGDNVIIKHKYLRNLTSLPRSVRLRPIPGGFGFKAAMARFVASAEGCQCVVFMTDADTKHEKERVEKIGEILAGFALFENEVKPVVCVPRSSSESWLLSDRDAWVSSGLPPKASLPTTSPEDLWGVRNDPEDDHPKHAFARVADQAGLNDDRETRRLIAEATSVEVLKERCPYSFVPFSVEVSQACAAPAGSG